MNNWVIGKNVILKSLFNKVIENFLLYSHNMFEIIYKQERISKAKN